MSDLNSLIFFGHVVAVIPENFERWLEAMLFGILRP
jgi:hypothetical protein